MQRIRPGLDPESTHPRHPHSFGQAYALRKSHTEPSPPRVRTPSRRRGNAQVWHPGISAAWRTAIRSEDRDVGSKDIMYGSRVGFSTTWEEGQKGYQGF